MRPGGHPKPNRDNRRSWALPGPSLGSRRHRVLSVPPLHGSPCPGPDPDPLSLLGRTFPPIPSPVPHRSLVTFCQDTRRAGTPTCPALSSPTRTRRTTSTGHRSVTDPPTDPDLGTRQPGPVQSCVPGTRLRTDFPRRTFGHRDGLRDTTERIGPDRTPSFSPNGPAAKTPDLDRLTGPKGKVVSTCPVGPVGGPPGLDLCLN